MARLPELSDRATLSTEARIAFDAVAGSRGGVRGPFAMLLHSPEVAERAAHLGAYLRFGSQIPDAERELAIITTARSFDCDYEWSAHVRIAREVGVGEDAISAIANREPTDALSAEQSTVIEFARELLEKKRVSGPVFERVRERFGDGGVIELTATVGYYAMIACVLNATEIEPPAGSPQLP
ncbi:MAG: carboxymuconolactone decarboxylase family protein [Chloroflexi bacterium]|nr:carboxymuconolactone decarboxylase family protein [Chloroflexota bacterium]